ncbi:D-hexose-6-phosphate mutarotase [Marinimicrobium agarilyticum]|uniref:D-hexose-6-phosphate mutarotase n=1 Tax=Marinimicrobium agarilyticum TaxID=306546 RepID=UPI0004018E63|nr:D-hexose-6-phosphate mutarotase [Marinimicrobium agarilyticum]
MATLAELVAPYKGVTLTDSRTLFPSAEGEGLPLIRVETHRCEAIIAPQGAQLLSFTKADGTPLLWLSPQCHFQPGKALRGGVPVCLPWFGPHPDGDKPQHGFARTSDWTLTQVAEGDDGRCELWFELRHPGSELFAAPFKAELRMMLGHQIELELSLTNEAEQPVEFTWALHSYLPVGDLDNAQVPALAGRTYLDNLKHHEPAQQSGPLTFDDEVDRVYPAVETAVTLEPTPRLEIEHRNCPSLVAWNPGADKAADMVDMGAGNERGFVCLERGAVLDEGWRLTPGETRRGSVVIKTA